MYSSPTESNLRIRSAVRTGAALAVCLAIGAGAALAKGGTTAAKPPKVPPPPAAGNPPVPAPPAVQSPPIFTPTTLPGDIHAFTVIGLIQNAIVDGSNCPTVPPLLPLPRRQLGGTVTVNGQTITVPCNSVVQFPANTLTWAELVDALPPAVTTSASLTTTSLALPAVGSTVAGGGGKFAYPSVEITVIGNFVGGKPIAGLILPISQETGNAGAGYIVSIDYANGAMLLGDKPAGPATTRIQINDPVINDPLDVANGTGRYSAGQTPDSRFSVDQQNPTITAQSGYPMCIPRQAPAIADDPACPQKNRPLVVDGCRTFSLAGIVFPKGGDFAPPAPGQIFCHGFVMKAAVGSTAGVPLSPVRLGSLLAQNIATSAAEPDARQQAPFEVGDSIIYSGALLRGDGQGPNGSDTISVNTIRANVGIFTEPGTLPAYVLMDRFTLGVFDSSTIFNGIPQEVHERLILNAFTTDVKSIADVYLVDRALNDGHEVSRWVTPNTMTSEAGDLGTNGAIIDGGITTQFNGPVHARIRIQANVANPVGELKSPTRFVRVALRSLCDPANVNNPGVPTVANPAASTGCLQRAQFANGLSTGQYEAPAFTYIFPEALTLGDPIVPNNFWVMGFLVNGEGPGTGPLIPQPW